MNYDYDIGEVPYDQAICIVAQAQLGLTGRELNAVEGWCGDFIFSCAMRCGIGSDVIPVTGSPREMYYGILNNGGKLIGWDYRAGDIAYYPFQGENGHIAIITDDETAVHGNMDSWDFLDSQVIQMKFKADENVIIIRPPYKEFFRRISENREEMAENIAEENSEINDAYENFEPLADPYYIYVASDKDKHVPAVNPIIENIVQPDCFNEGSYEKVIYCKDCGIELQRMKVFIGRIYHHLVKIDSENLQGNTTFKCTYCNNEFS